MSTFFIGLDLGKTQDPTAIAIFERFLAIRKQEPKFDNRIGYEEAVKKAKSRERRLFVYHCRYLRRWELGTDYMEISKDLRDMVEEKPELRNCICGVDETGVGSAVVEMIRAFRPQCRIIPVLITTGHKATLQKGSIHVAKKQLASVLMVLYQSRRIHISTELDHAETLNRELGNFKVKITASGNETFEAWREKEHDDLVLAACIAAWLGETMGGIGGKPFSLNKPLMPNPYSNQ